MLIIFFKPFNALFKFVSKNILIFSYACISIIVFYYVVSHANKNDKNKIYYYIFNYIA